MPVTKFNFNSINVDVLSSWPECHAREQCGLGRQRYAKFLPHLKINSKRVFNNIVTYNSLVELKIIPPPNGFYHLHDPVPLIMEHLIVNEARFIDEEFGAGHLRLINRSANVNLYNTFPMFSSFGQRSLGHCLLVCNIGAVAAHPEGNNLLLSSIYPPVYNPYGVYSVRLFFEGKEIFIIIDDYIPFHLNYSGMINQNECWFFLLEKAICKLNVFTQVGHYFLNAGENYKFLKGAGANVLKYFYLEKKDLTKFNGVNKDEFWKCIVTNLRHHKTPYVVQFANHAYLIVDAFEYKGTRLIRWHNPVNYIVNYNGPFEWKRREDWDQIPQQVQTDFMENDRFMNGNVHTTYWTTYEVYLNRGIHVTYHLQKIKT